MSDVTNEAPETTDAPAEETTSEAPANEPVQQDETAVDQTETNEVEETSTEDQEAPTQSDQEQSDQPKKSEDLSHWDSYLPKNRPSPEPKVGEDGYIDPLAYKEQIKAEMREEARFEANERRAWGKLEEKYPEIVEDSDLRELILAKRLSDVQRGGQGSLIQSGEAVMKKFGQARNSGKTDAQVSVKKQKSAGVSKATAPRDTSSSDVDQRLRSGDEQAIASVLAGWIDDGKL